MASNSKSTTLYPKSGYGYTLYCSFSEQKLTDDQTSRNVTRIDAYGLLQANGTYWSTSYWSSIVLYWHDNRENKDIEIARSDFAGLGGTYDKRECSTSFDITHKDDGTLSGYVWIKFNKGSTTSVYAPAGDGSVGTDWTALTTVPRATNLPSQTLTINTEGEISWVKAAAAFTHTLTYEFGELSGTIGTAKTLVDSVKWTPPDEFYQQMTDAPSQKGKLFLATYNGDTQIGSTQEAVLTINANKDEADVIIEEFSIRDENTKTSTLTGDKTTLVLTKSLAFVTLVFKTRKYAKVKSVYINDKQVGVSEGVTSNGETSYGVTTDLGIATTGTFKVRIIDTRDFPKEKTTTNSVINYIPLSARALFKRIAPTTGEIGLSFEGDYFGQSFGDEQNELTISYKYKKTNEETYSDETYFIEDTHYKTTTTKYYSGNSETKQTLVLNPHFDYKSAYNLVLNVKDKLTDYPPINVVVVKGIPIMWWNGDKVTINGELYIADENGENAMNVREMSGGIEIIRWEAE